ncbi:MAG TPA: aspartate-semialdehyde dehydrogenase, partial [Flavobacteriales bacterium]|nr:aspartate-semialdehyde dehydrogenase [Flavobacteriales bacterium]HIK66497.1 aspartate-semialdehyde dehydrogenase [Flavobacteriales bacterium]
MKSLRIAIVGATGLVGTTVLKILEERNFPIATLLPVASEKSIGKFIKYGGAKVGIISL